MLVLIGVVVIKSACFNLYEFIFVWFCDNEYPESWDLIIVCFCLRKLGLSGISSTWRWRNSLDYNVRGKMCFTLVSSFLTDLSYFWLIIFFFQIFPINIKGSAGSLTILVSWIGSWIVSYTFNSLFDWSSIGEYTSLAFQFFLSFLQREFG